MNIAGYGPFLLADRFEMSGVLASLTAGLLMGNMGWRGPISANGRGHVKAFLGICRRPSELDRIHPYRRSRSPAAFVSLWTAAVLAIALVLMGRAAAFYPLCALVARANHPMDMRYRHVLFWGGLRGAIALALALTAALPERQEIIVVAFAVVAFSIFAQGLTMPWLVCRLGLMKAD